MRRNFNNFTSKKSVEKCVLALGYRYGLDIRMLIAILCTKNGFALLHLNQTLTNNLFLNVPIIIIILIAYDRP